MGTLSLDLLQRANRSAEQSFGTPRTNVRCAKMTSEIMRLAYKLIAGTRKNLAEQAKVSIRTIDNWKSGDRTVRLEELFHLLDGPEGVAFFQAFWDQVPESTRERWIKGEILRRRLAERALERDREDREIEQLRMELSGR